MRPGDPHMPIFRNDKQDNNNVQNRDGFQEQRILQTELVELIYSKPSKNKDSLRIRPKPVGSKSCYQRQLHDSVNEA